MGFLNHDQMLDAMHDTSWTNDEPPGQHPLRFCEFGGEPSRNWEDHNPHVWWSPELVRTRVFGNKVEHTQEIAWFRCGGTNPATTTNKAVRTTE